MQAVSLKLERYSLTLKRWRMLVLAVRPRHGEPGRGFEPLSSADVARQSYSQAQSALTEQDSSGTSGAVSTACDLRLRLLGSCSSPGRKYRCFPWSR